MGAFGSSFLAGYFHLVVHRRSGFMDIKDPFRNVAYPMGKGLRFGQGTEKRKQKSVFKKTIT